MRLPGWWRPWWFWGALTLLVVVGLATASVLRGMAARREPAESAQTVPHAWDGHTVHRLATVVSAAGPEGTTVRLMVATVSDLGPCLGVVVSTPSLDAAEGPSGNSECDSTVAAVLTDPASQNGVASQLVWEWRSSRTGRIWDGYFGITATGSAVRLLVGGAASDATPVTRHAYLSIAVAAPSTQRPCTYVEFLNDRGSSIMQSSTNLNCPAAAVPNANSSP